MARKLGRKQAAKADGGPQVPPTPEGMTRGQRKRFRNRVADNMADAAVLGPAIPGGTAAAGGATAAADESPLTTRSDSYSTKVITEAPRQFSDWFEQQMLKPEFKHAARKIALDPKFIATILTKTIQARIDGFELVEKQKKHGDIIDVKVNGEPMRHIRDDGSPGDAISIKTAFEWDDDPSQKDYDRKTAKDMKIQRQELGDMLYAEYLRRSGNLLDRNEQRLVAENPWTDDINDLQMGIIHTTMSAMDASTGWVGTTPQDVWFSSLEQWAETMHPDKKGQYMGSVLHDMSKSMLKLGGADQPKVDHGVRLIRKEDAKAYIKGKVDEQIRYARNTAEKIAYAVITTPANEEVVVTIRDVKGNDKQVELGVPGLGMEVPGTETLRKKKTSLDAKDQEYQRRSPSLEDHRERKRKIEAKEIRDDGIDHAGEIEAIEELGREVSELKAEYHKLASTDARAKERAADVAKDLLLALLNTKEPLGTYLEQNPTRFCGEVNQNSVLSSILGEIDGLVIQRQSLDKFSPGKRRLVEETEEIKDGSTKITRKYEGEDDAPLPLFEARKRRLEANVTALTARIDAEELPDDLKEELVSLAESVKDTNLKTEKVKEHVETQKKMLAKAINPMRAVVEEVGREMDFQMLIMYATYDGGLDRAKGEAPPINKMNIIEVQLRRFWKLFDHAHWPKIKQKVKDFISTPFRWLDDGMYGTLPPLELQRPGEDADFKGKAGYYARIALRALRQAGYVAAWPFGSALLRRWKNWDEDNERTGFQWKLLRGASMAVLGPTYLWSIVQGSFTDKFGYVEPSEKVERLQGWKKFWRRVNQHGFGLSKGILGSLLLTPVIGVGAVGLTGQAYTMLDAPIRRAVLNARVDNMQQHEECKDGEECETDEEFGRRVATARREANSYQAFRRVRVERTGEGERLAGLEGVFQDIALNYEYFLGDCYSEVLGFPSGYYRYSLVTLMLPVNVAPVEDMMGGMPWPIDSVTWTVSFRSPSRPEPGTSDYFDMGYSMAQEVPSEYIDYMNLTFPGITGDSRHFLADPERNRFARQRKAGGYVFLREPEAGEERSSGGRRGNARQRGNEQTPDGGPETEADGGPVPEGDGGPEPQGDSGPETNGDAGAGE